MISVTITGADDNVSVDQLAAFSAGIDTVRFMLGLACPHSGDGPEAG